MSLSDGKVYYWDNVLTPVLDVDGKTQSILCVSRDITLQYLTEQKLKQGSERDELTGLNNRRAFKEKIRKLYSSARDKKQKLAVMLMDLDHFKTINDTLGYAAGDHLLRILSKRLKQIFSVHDKFHRTLILSGFCLLKIAKISLNSSFFPKPIKR